MRRAGQPHSRRLQAALAAAPLLLGHTQTAKPFFPPFGIDLSAIDRTTRPQDDFFQYANGAWLNRTEIPPDRTDIGVDFVVGQRVQTRLRAILEDAAAHAPAHPVTDAQKAGAMYAAFLDEATIERLGGTPIAPDLSAIRAAQTPASLAGLMGASMRGFGRGFFSLDVSIDLKDVSQYALILDQSGLGLPDRDYYLQPQFAAQKAAYQAYAARLLHLINWPDADARAADIVALETKIAAVSWTHAQRRNPRATYNPVTLAELRAMAPGFDWQAFLHGAGLYGINRLIANEKSAMGPIAAVFAGASPDALRAWLAFGVADTAADDLSTPFQQARFDFRAKTLNGQPQIQPRWKRAITAVAGTGCGDAPGACLGTLEWVVGQLYVAHDFPPAARAHAERMAAALTDAFAGRLLGLDWMSPFTKSEALRKLQTYTVKVGYPDHPRGGAGIDISRTDLAGDVRHAAAADWAYRAGHLGHTVDFDEWLMTPQTVNAYNGYLRDIVFPAAILQPPYFDPAADDAVNFGQIGGAIGHEMTHGFDDEGRTLDANGSLRDWWAPEDAAAFKARAAQLGAQFAKFEPVPGTHINPELTMGENIADLGGLLIALDAYHASLHDKPAPVLGGLTGDQRFFIAYAQSWSRKARPDSIREQTVSDPHSYDKFRVLGPLANVDAWYDAFGVKPGDRMYIPPEKRVRIW